jgi:hypothetical protein
VLMWKPCPNTSLKNNFLVSCAGCLTHWPPVKVSQVVCFTRPHIRSKSKRYFFLKYKQQYSGVNSKKNSLINYHSQKTTEISGPTFPWGTWRKAGLFGNFQKNGWKSNSCEFEWCQVNVLDSTWPPVYKGSYGTQGIH